MTRQTHTYAVLDVAQATYDDIVARLELAGYGHLVDQEHGHIIDMHGIGLAVEPTIVEAEDDGDYIAPPLVSWPDANRLLTWALIALATAGAWLTLSGIVDLVTR